MEVIYYAKYGIPYRICPQYQLFGDIRSTQRMVDHFNREVQSRHLLCYWMVEPLLLQWIES